MKSKFTPTLLLALILCACSTAQPYQNTTQRDIDALTNKACFAMPQVKVPSFPNRSYNILDYGADPSGVALATEAIQKAIDECTNAGGGTVIIPAGIYTTGPIQLKSNVRLYTEPNSLVVFSHDLDLYEIYDTWFEGIPTKRCTSPINAFNAENIAITGEGSFNGNGDWWRPLKKNKMAAGQWKEHLLKGGVVTEKGIWYPDSASILAQTYCEDQNVPVINDDALWQKVKSFLRPVMIHFVGCKNILLEGVTFENSPAWNIHPMCCENLILRDLNVRNPWYSQNGDGVDVESCKNVVISHCSFDVGDDAICMKSGKNAPGRERGIPTENVVVDDCTVYHGHGGFVCGSEMSGGIKNVQVSNNLYIGTDVGLRFKSTRGRGGVVENIFIKGINMINIPNEGLLFDLFYGGKGAGEETEEEIAARMNAAAPEVSEETPAFRNIVIEDVNGLNLKRAIYFNGLPEMKIQNVTLRNITMTATDGALFRQTDGLTVENVDIHPAQGEPFTLAPSVENVSFK
ncbi:MAG: glycoside hydrolase family 28 protein [Paludibacteraceae bacterium]|nr:glycoside hydrolase family 28 protein [Paludibacteraceae bacterium]